MSFRSRFFSAFLVAVMLCLVLYQGLRMENGAGNQGIDVPGGKETVHVWYTDEALTDYMNSRALNYMEEHEDVRIVPTLVSAVEYLETINKATMEQEVYPDLFLLTNDSLEKAYMAGLATEITNPEQKVSSMNFPMTAIRAVTYDGKMVAYPFYYDTSIFLYNHTYLETMAKTKAEALASQAEADAAEGEAAQEEAEPAVTVSGADDIVPQTFEEILAVADEYDAPEGVESILKWDVSDIFYNYFFAGNYMNIGGENGDDSTIVDVCNEQSVACMQMYQSLNQFFSIEADETDYNLVLDEFIQGKTLFTVATTDAIARLEQAKADGTFTWEYGVTTMPDVNAELASKALSVTNTVVVNGFGQKKEIANDFASYLTCGVDASLYERTGKLAAASTVVYDNPKLAAAMDSYAESANLPKIMQASNFWVQLEVAYTGIWQGEDAQAKLQALEDQMIKQIQ